MLTVGLGSTLIAPPPSKETCSFLSVNSSVAPGKSGSGFELTLEWCGLVIHTAHATRTTRSRFFFLGHLSHQCLGGEQGSGQRGGVLQCCASHLGRIDDAGLYQVLVFAGSHVEPFIAPAILDFLNDQSAFLPSVVGELACRKRECASNDFRTNSLITFQLNVVERLLCAKVSNPSAGNDTLLDGRTGRMQGIFHASFLLLHFGLSGGNDIDHGNNTGQLCHTFLQFFTIVVRSGFLDLTTNLLNSALDIFGR